MRKWQRTDSTEQKSMVDLLARICSLFFVLCSLVYRFVISVRNYLYDHNVLKVRWVPVPVIAVGNLTTGGTGKTPMTIFLAHKFRSFGVMPGVILRGYGSQMGQPSDEERLLRAELPAVPIVADPDRQAAAVRAVEQSARMLIADDAYQHRRLGRDLNICLIDAAYPFGSNALLPAGRLREPVSALSRADLVVITRSDQALTDTIDELTDRIGTYCPSVPVLLARHCPAGLVDLTGRSADMAELSGRRVLAFAGIARPEAFYATLRAGGAELVDTVNFHDHHDYSGRDLTELAARGLKSEAEWMVCTAKDAVKLSRDDLSSAGPDPKTVFAMKIAIEFSADHQRVLDGMLCELLDSFSPDVLETICTTGSAN